MKTKKGKHSTWIFICAFLHAVSLFLCGMCATLIYFKGLNFVWGYLMFGLLGGIYMGFVGIIEDDYIRLNYKRKVIK